jgi:two-component system chemotaxis response regulator CheB
MSQLHLGEVISDEQGVIQFSLPSNLILVWRDKFPAEAVICEKAEDIPSNWKHDLKISWKIFGEFKNIKSILPGFNVPAGTKIVDVAEGVTLQMNLTKGVIRYMGNRKKRVVVVDDSSTIRKLLRHIIESFEGWEVVAEIENAESIPDAIKTHHPDLVTLDLHLGEVNGAEAMKKFLAPRKVPTLIITSQPRKDGGLVMEALEAGALDYLHKPESGKWDFMREELLFKMESALKSKWQSSEKAVKKAWAKGQFNFNPDDFIVGIGSSTGGTQALQQIFTNLPENIPPILVTQHIPAGFSKALAERLDKLCPFEVKEAEDGDDLKPNRILIAPGDHHMRLSRSGKKVEVFAGEPVDRFRPSVEVMFQSIALNAKSQVIAIMLTGMGKDGSKGMLELHSKGALTIAQDEGSCVVFGMPKEAIKLGAVDIISPLKEIAETLMSELNRKSLKRKI